MASTTSPPSVAIAGATGHLGCRIAAAFLEPRVRPQFSKIVLLMRKPVDDIAQLLGVSDASGVTVRIYDEASIEASIRDIDIVVCTIGVKGDAFRQKLVYAMAKTQVRLYFPSEFGIDRNHLDFPHPEWDHKKAHYALACQYLPSTTRICRVYPGLLLEDSIGPWFGFHTKAARYEIIGAPDVPSSFTSLTDVGRAVVQLSLLPPEKIIDQVRIAGDTKTPAQIARIMEKAGSPTIKMEPRDVEPFKQNTLASTIEDPAPYLRFLMSEGKLNNEVPIGGGPNDNDLVNSGEKNWRWKTLENLARETGGMPWADVSWPPS